MQRRELLVQIPVSWSRGSTVESLSASYQSKVHAQTNRGWRKINGFTLIWYFNGWSMNSRMTWIQFDESMPFAKLQNWIHECLIWKWQERHCWSDVQRGCCMVVLCENSSTLEEDANSFLKRKHEVEGKYIKIDGILHAILICIRWLESEEKLLT